MLPSGMMLLVVAESNRAMILVRVALVMVPAVVFLFRRSSRFCRAVASAIAVPLALGLGAPVVVLLVNFVASVGMKPRQARVKRSLFWPLIVFTVWAARPL